MPKYKVKHLIRFPPAIYAKICKIAEIEHRSINGQVVMAIETFVQQYETAHGPLPTDEDTPTP